MRKILLSSFALILAINVIAPSSANPNAANGKSVPSANASGYWTAERRDNAIPREFQFEVGATEGKLVPQARKGGSGGGSNTTSGTVYWPVSQQSQFVAQITGKIFFTMGSGNYVCSGSLVNDAKTDIALVITAAHCVWDNTGRAFATNWAFFPNYDKDAASLRGKGYSASALFAPFGFTNQTSFNTTATLNDFAFAVLTTNELNLSGLPNISQSSSFTSNRGDAFGYPAASPFNGEDLVYSTGVISTDRNNGGKTWRLPSTMTGGASGGPWYNGFSTGTVVGSVSSVNSYKYNSDKNSMYGPKFNSVTQDVLNVALSGACAVTDKVNCK